MRRAAALPIAASLAVAGCGAERAAAPDLSRPADPRGRQVVRAGDHGIAFTAPGNWSLVAQRGQLAAAVQSGTATVAVWRYPRTEPLPASDAELEAAQARLEAQVRSRDPSFEQRSSDVVRRAGAPALELTGRQTMGGESYDVRSSHVFRDGAEIVVDAYAPPAEFARVDARVFRPLLESLRVSAP